jgi:hypothetical protein
MGKQRSAAVVRLSGLLRDGNDIDGIGKTRQHCQIAEIAKTNTFTADCADGRG